MYSHDEPLINGMTIMDLAFLSRGFFLDKPKTKWNMERFCFYILEEFDGKLYPSEVIADVLNTLFGVSFFDCDKVGRIYRQGRIGSYNEPELPFSMN